MSGRKRLIACPIVQSDDTKNVYNKWYADQRYMNAYKSTKTLRGIDVEGSTLTISMQSKHSLMPRISMPADGKPRKALTASKENFFRMFGTLTLRWQTSPLVPNCLTTVNKPELGRFYCDWSWAAELCGFLQEFTPAPEKDFGGASGQRGASIKVPGSAQLVWSCTTSSPACSSQC